MKIIHFVLIILSSILLSACASNASAMAKPTQIDIPALQTATVSSIIAQYTQTAVSKPTLAPSPTHSAELIKAVNPKSGNGNSDPANCENDSAYISDSSIDDGTQIPAGQEFVKTWKIKNTGSCTWKPGFQMIFGYGNKMAGVPGVLSSEVLPGDEIEISVTLKAPDNFGNYCGFWRLINDRGLPFGQFFSVVIAVP